MTDLRNLLSAAAEPTRPPSDTALSFRGLEEAHVVCHVKSSGVMPGTTEKRLEKPGHPPPAQPVPAQPRLSVSISDSHDAVCQLCQLGHKTRHGKDVGKVLTFSTDTSSLEIHHLCGTLALRGVKTAFTMEELRDALDESRMRRCHACNAFGAFIRCCYDDCARWYHLGCSMNATDVVVDMAIGQLYCPKHTVPYSDDSQDDGVVFGNKPKKQRSSTGTKATPGQKKKKPAVSVQRPRTDWQRRGPDTWVKVVPPWWAEQKTVHFANKVFRELFLNNLEVDLLDEGGTAWKCEVVKETRNDMRLQFTLMGQFQDLWAHAGIMPGDVLTFEKTASHPGLDPERATHVIKMTKHAQGVGFEDLIVPKARNSRANATSTANAAASKVRRRVSRHAPETGKPKVVTQETPWFFAGDHVARKVMHPNNVAKTRCPMTDHLVSKIAGDNPDSGQLGPTFAVYDPAIKRHFVFDVDLDPHTSIRHITGSGFLSWMVEAAVKPEDSIQLEFADSTTGIAGTILVSKISFAENAADDLPKAPSSDCSSNTSMKTLAAAACYCHTHGTPGIRALLDFPSSEQRM